MKAFSKTQAQQYIHAFFAQPSCTQEEVRKIKRLAMRYRIKLQGYRKRFCTSCLAQLKGSIRITKGYKTVICANCKKRNRFKLV